jgi:hypothetical protein
MKIWVIKQLVMTKYFICSILLLALFTGVSNTSAASFKTITLATASDQKSSGLQSPIDLDAALPVRNIPVNTGSHGQEKGPLHPPALDETPHIHHYHKNRVRKLKKHHGKFWFLSQLLIVVCHLVLLFMAYLHIVH